MKNIRGEDIKIEIEQKVRRKGKKKLRIGFALVFVALVVSILFSIQNDGTLWENVELTLKMLIPGLIFIAIGYRQYSLKDDHAIRETNIETYGVEEPDKLWECPKCKNDNPNYTYKCESCGYSLT